MKLTRRFLISVGLLTVLLLATVSVALAGIKNNPPPLAGYTHSDTFADDSPQKHGILLSDAAVVRSAPVIANVSISSTGNEVVVAGSDGVVYAYSRTGVLLWQTNVFASSSTPSCTPVGGDAKLNSSPAVGDLDGNGTPSVVIGYGTIQASNCDGGIVALNGNTGAVEWRYSLRDFTKIPSNASETLFGVVSSPALADTDGDGKLEVGFGGLDRKVHLLNYDGSQRWYYAAADTVWSSPAFADINGDGRLEMIVGTDISESNVIVPPQAAGGFVYAFDTQSRTVKEIQFREAGAYVWQTFLEQVIYSSPAIGDVLSSNQGLEVVIGSGCWHPLSSTNKVGKWVKILRLSDGMVLSTLIAPTCLRSSPALGDIDNDGKLEVVATVTGATEFGGSGRSKVIAWDPDTGSQKWSFEPNDANLPAGSAAGNDPHGDDIQSPVIADLDGNGSLEVVVANVWTVHVVRGDTGAALTCQSSSCGTQLSLWAWWTLKSTPAIGDVDGDGDLEVVIGGGHLYGPGGGGARGLLYAWTNLSGLLGSPAGSQPAYSAPWPIFRGNAQHNGRYSLPSLSASTDLIPLYQTTGSAGTLQATFRVINAGGGSMNWSASPTAGINLSSSSGSTMTETTITVTVSVGSAPNGVYDLGSITLTSSNAINSPLTISVKRYVGPMIFLPMIKR